MKYSASLIVVLAIVVTGKASAGDEPVAKASEMDSPWTFGGALTLRFGVEASFQDLGRWNSPFSIQAAGGGIDRFYDDGSNLVDVTGNVGGLTSNWGVSNSSQFGQTAPNTVSMNLHNSVANGSVSGVDDAQTASPGLELFARYEVGEHWGLSKILKRKVTWGWGGGAFYQHVGISNGSTLRSDVLRTSETFASGPVVVGVLPYQGPFSPVPGAPLIPDHPVAGVNNSTWEGGAIVMGDRKISAELIGVNFGPWLEIPLTEKLDLQLEAGVSLALAFGEYDAKSIVTIPGIGTQRSSIDSDKVTFLPGAYLGAGLNYELTDNVMAMMMVRWQTMKDLTLSSGGSEADLDFSSSVVVQVGFGMRF